MELIAALTDLCKEKSRPIIAIDGPAGAGKTTLASEIFLALSSKISVEVIHMMTCMTAGITLYLKIYRRFCNT